MEYWAAKPHALQKYTILTKYLAACGNFARRYGNFAYIDTHGGSGLVEMVEEAPLFELTTRQTEGSPLIAARAVQAWEGGKQFPCHIVEIHPGRYETLCQSTAQFPWVQTHHGDCNALLPQVFASIPRWAFVLCFVDPDGLVYHGPGSAAVPQFTWATMEKIAARAKVELLLNFPLEAILRCAGYCHKQADQPAALAMANNMTTFFGSEGWRDLSGKRALLDYYLRRLQRLGFSHVGAYYVNCRGLPLYYLAYATRNSTGAKIMRDVMRAEWRTVHHLWAAEAEQIGLDHPVEHFVFDNEGLPTQGDYPPDWDEIAKTVKDEASWRCEECGTEHNPDPKAGYILTVHHRDGNPANCARGNLVALCQRCHLRVQSDARRSSPGEQTAEQLMLFEEQ